MNYWVTSDNWAFRKKEDCERHNQFSTVRERGIKKMTLSEIKKAGNIFIPFKERRKTL